MQGHTRMGPNDINEAHPHMTCMKIVRACMTTSVPCIEAGIKHCHEYNMKAFGAMMAKMEKGEKKHIVLHDTSMCEPYISTKHGAFFVFRDLPSPGETTVVFRQSYCKCNWITNLQWLPRKQDGIHSGFYFLSTTLMDALKACIDKIGQGKIYFTGMSLGGAMCALMAYRMVTEAGLDPRRVEVVQFASPRIGLAHWADKYNQRLGNNNNSYHYHSTCDLFANSPPPRAGNYQHVGNQIHVSDFGYGNHLHMRAHTKILGLSFASGMNIPLALSMVIRGDRMLSSWDRIMALVSYGV